MLRGVSWIVRATSRDGPFLDPFSFRQNRLTASEVNIGWGQVFQALMVSLMIVVIDERLDRFFKITGEKVVLRRYPVGKPEIFGPVKLLGFSVVD